MGKNKVIQTNNALSKTFPLQCETCQGCPLSPLLFTLSLELLSQTIRLALHISPISIQRTQNKISLYADDVLLFFTKMSESLPQILKVFTQFSLFSDYKINWDKSLLIPLNALAKDLSLPVTQHIQWHNSPFTYLGITMANILHTILIYHWQTTINAKQRLYRTFGGGLISRCHCKVELRS